MDKKQLKSLSVLGWNFALHLLRSLIPKKKKNQAEVFKGYFQKDWISAFSPEEIKLIFNLENCTVCGLCDQSCLPALLGEGKFLGPQYLVSCSGRSQPEYIFDLEHFLYCTLCGKCEQVCPQEVKVAELALLMRRWIYRIEPEKLWECFGEVKENIERYKNPFGKGKVEPESKIKKGASILFVGCFEEARGEPKRWQELLSKLGIDAQLITGICCGGFLEEMGAQEIDFGLTKLVELEPKEIITICPHCFYTLNRKLGNNLQIKFILELLADKKLAFNQKLAQPVIYFDPCYLSKKSGLIELPREIIRKAGWEMIEYPESKELADCCGAGGGLYFYDREFAKKIAKRKISEAVSLGAKTVLTECGLCKELLSCALKDYSIKVERLSQVLF